MFEVLYISMLVFWGGKPMKKSHQQEIYEVIYQVSSIDKCPHIFVDSTCKGWRKSAHERHPSQSWNCYRVFQHISIKILLKSQEGHPIAATLDSDKDFLSGNSTSHSHLPNPHGWFHTPFLGVCFWKIRLRINFLRFQRGKSQVTKFC